LRALAAELPADRIMVETDSPYLGAGKFRGKRNEPSYVVKSQRCWRYARGVAGRNFAADDRKLLPPVLKSARAEGGRMTLTLTILGCGSSAGVRVRRWLGRLATPPIQNRRRRCSLLVECTSDQGTPGS